MAGVGGSKSSPEWIAVTEKQAKALEMRKAGATFLEIAEELEYASPSGAFEAVKSALDKTLREPANSLRELELERLDTMWATVWENVLSGDLDSMSMALKIAERRARLLGLDIKESTLKHQLDLEGVRTLRELVSVKDKDKQK